MLMINGESVIDIREPITDREWLFTGKARLLSSSLMASADVAEVNFYLSSISNLADVLLTEDEESLPWVVSSLRAYRQRALESNSFRAARGLLDITERLEPQPTESELVSEQSA